MGLKNRSATGQYVKIKEGKFYLTKDETNTPFDELEGTLVDMYFKDEEYQGQAQRKLYLVMNDGDTNFIVGFRIDSRYASTFFQFVKSIDITKPFSLHSMSKVMGEGADAKNIGSLLISQNGKFAKAYFTREHPNGLPEMKKVRFNGKDLWDKSDMLEFYENLVERELKPMLPKGEQTVIQDEVSSESGDEPWNNKSKTSKTKVVKADEEDDDLPF